LVAPGQWASMPKSMILEVVHRIVTH
jgi:hypothetical protein